MLVVVNTNHFFFGLVCDTYIDIQVWIEGIHEISSIHTRLAHCRINTTLLGIGSVAATL